MPCDKISCRPLSGQTSPVGSVEGIRLHSYATQFGDVAAVSPLHFRSSAAACGRLAAVAWPNSSKGAVGIPSFDETGLKHDMIRQLDWNS